VGPARGVRPTGTTLGSEDEQRAAEYLTGRLDALGVDHQRFDPELYISQPHDATIKTINKTFEPGIVKTVGFSASTTVRGEVEYVGTASSDLVDDGEERARASPSQRWTTLMGGSHWSTVGASLSARRRCSKKGAGGVIAIHEHRREPRRYRDAGLGWRTLRRKDRIPNVPIANVTKPDGEVLRKFATAEEGLEIELSTDLTTDWMECPIVEARIEAGNADPDNDDFLLLHGHYDSWYVGITDNATGDAGMLELARVFERTR